MKRSVPGSSPRRDPSLAGNRLQLTPSQQRLLERLEFMTSFDGPLIALCGLNGAGKTTLAVQLLDRSDGVNAALVTLAAPVNDDDLRRQLGWQLAGEFEGDGQLPLAELCDAITARGERLLMVIDGAQHLGSAQFDAIADAVRGGELNPGSRVAVLVVDRDGGPAPEWLADPLISPLQLEPLPAAEQVALWRGRIGAAGDNYSDAQLGPWLERVAPTISHVLRLADDGMVPGSRQVDSGSRSQRSPVLWALALVVLLVGGWLLWPSSTPQPLDPAGAETAAVPPAPLAIDASSPAPQPDALLDDTTLVEAEPAGLDAERQGRPALRVEVPANTVDDALSKSQIKDVAVVTDGITVAVADPLLLEDAPAAKPVAATIEPLVAAAADVPMDAPAVNTPVTAAASKPAAKPVAQVASTKPAVAGSNQPFHTPAGAAYTLQLAAMHSESGIRSFASQQLANKGPWAIVRTSRDGRAWYLLIQGRYASAAAARQGLATLPAAARQYGAWPKPLTAIHAQGFTVVTEAP